VLTFRRKRELKLAQRRILVDSIQIGLASPDQIRQWAERELPNGKKTGRVANPKTVDYKTLKPVRDGLFCERIFGPVKDCFCSCGKRQGSSRARFCPECEVEWTKSRVRRYRLGYIDLASPVTHVWYIKGRPNYVATLLGEKQRSIEAIAYCTRFVIGGIEEAPLPRAGGGSMALGGCTAERCTPTTTPSMARDAQRALAEQGQRGDRDPQSASPIAAAPPRNTHGLSGPTQTDGPVDGQASPVHRFALQPPGRPVHQSGAWLLGGQSLAGGSNPRGGLAGPRGSSTLGDNSLRRFQAYLAQESNGSQPGQQQDLLQTEGTGWLAERGDLAVRASSQSRKLAAPVHGAPGQLWNSDNLHHPKLCKTRLRQTGGPRIRINLPNPIQRGMCNHR
jgi:hypothetical protein